MTEPDVTLQHIAATLARINPHLRAKPIGFDPELGRLSLECADRAWRTQMKLIAGRLIGQLNTELGAPIVQTILATTFRTRVLITGSRTWDDTAAVESALLDTWHDLTHVHGKWALMRVVHGACPNGADAHAAAWAADQDPECVSAEAHPANWDSHGRAAGVRRNAEMVRLGADVCLAFIKDGSRGATHTADLAEKAGIPVRRFTA